MNVKKQEICNRIWMENKEAIENRCKFKLRSCPDEIDDVIADIAYQLCVAVINDKIHTNPKGWLFAVADNLIKKKYNEINKKKSRYTEYNEECFENVESSVIDEDLFLDSLISDSVIEDLGSTIIDELSENNKRLFVFVHKDKLKLKEIAEIFSISTDAVKQRNKRLTMKLKQMVKDHIEEL